MCVLDLTLLHPEYEHGPHRSLPITTAGVARRMGVSQQRAVEAFYDSWEPRTEQRAARRATLPLPRAVAGAIVRRAKRCWVYWIG